MSIWTTTRNINTPKDIVVRELVFDTKEKFKNFLKQFGVIDE